MFIDALKILLFGVFAGVLPSLALIFQITKDKDHCNLIDRLVMAVLLSPLVLVLLSLLEEVLGVPQSPLVLTLNLLMLAVLNILLVFRYFRRRRYYSLSLPWGKLLAYMLFLAVLIFRVLPTEELSTALLHDSISHSQWLKQLHENHFTTTEKWYPQGLEYFLNYFATYFNVNYSKVVLTWTNYFTALFPVGFFYMGLLLIRKAENRYLVYPMALLTLAAIARIPADLYFIAGKNSMIFAFCVTPVILYMIYISRDKLDNLITAALIFSAIVVHYPTGFLLLVIFFVMNLLKIVLWTSGRLRVDRQALHGLLPGIGVLTGLGLVLAYRVVPIFHAYPLEDDRSTASVQSFIELHGLFKYVGDNFYLKQVSLLGTAMIILFIASLSLFLFAGNGKELKKFTGYFLISYVVLYVLGVALLMLPNKTQGAFYSFQLQYFFAFTLIIVSAWSINFVLTSAKAGGSKAVYSVSLLALAAIVLYIGYYQYNQYLDEQEVLNTTTDADFEAYRFINHEIDDDKRFLIQLSGGNDIIMGSDSGVWIPSFTDKDVEVDFTDYFNQKSYKIFDLYIAVASDSEDLEALSALLCDYDVGYIFFGSRKVFSDNMQKETLDGSPYLEKIFDNGASIYRIEVPSCS